MDTPALVKHHDRDLLVGTWDRLIVAVWRLHPYVEKVAELNRLVRAFVDERRDATSLLMVIEPQSPVPDAPARAELLKLTRELIPRMAIGVALAEGGGFRVATVRSVGVALTAIVPHRMPLKFVSTIDEAAKLIAPHLSPGLDAEALKRAVADFRARAP